MTSILTKQPRAFLGNVAKATRGILVAVVVVSLLIGCDKTTESQREALIANILPMEGDWVTSDGSYWITIRHEIRDDGIVMVKIHHHGFDAPAADAAKEGHWINTEGICWVDESHPGLVVGNYSFGAIDVKHARLEVGADGILSFDRNKYRRGKEGDRW